MIFFLVGMMILGVSGLAAWGASRRATLCSLLGAGGAVVGSILAMVPAWRGLAVGFRVPGGLWGARTLGGSEIFRCAWHVPGGSFFIALDALSSFFLIPILVLSLIAAVYGWRYMKAHASERPIGGIWLFFNLLIAGMAMVVVARNAVLFMIAWEVMALASYFLVTFEHDKPEVRNAGWTYLVATHLGTAFLLVFFLLIGQGSLDFDHFAPGAHAGLLFVLAVVGFGAKAGLMPLHVWLPEAHPVAPSHVSALMSGVMIKTGLYGLLRALILLGAPPAWWGWVLVCIGLVSGILGVLFAMVQHDLKRLLAYSSVENVGMITLGFGMGLLGVSYQLPTVAILGFAGGLLHVINHALFKGLLFLGAGSVMHATHTKQMDRMGGLFKRMPWTGGTFLVGVMAICGLPPLNGFISEWLLYLGAYASVKAGGHATMLGMAGIGGLALIGGLAVACFTKVFGIVFLGEPRSEQAAAASEVRAGMRWPMLVLAAGCLGVGLGSWFVVRWMTPVIAQILGQAPVQVATYLEPMQGMLVQISLGAGGLILLVMILAWIRAAILRGRPVRVQGTWGCGYAHPTSRMQYTGSSFIQPLAKLFGAVLRTRKRFTPLQGFFPAITSFETQTQDLSKQYVYRPLFLGMDRLAMRLRVIQHGRVNLYVLYIALALGFLLIREFCL